MKYKKAIAHFREIYPEFQESYISASKKFYDAKPESSASIRIRYATGCFEIGVLEFVLKQDVLTFKSKLSEAASIQYELFKGFDLGEEVDESYVSVMPGIEAIYRAMASGNIELAKQISGTVGGRDEIETRYDHPYNLALGYLLKSFVEDAGGNEKRWRIEAFRDVREPHTSGVIAVFEALLENDDEALTPAFEKLLVDHRNANSVGGIYHLELGKIISVYGIALANLVKYSGMTLVLDDPYIPRVLLV